MVTLKVIGSKCTQGWECFQTVNHSYCSDKGVCKCNLGYTYDKPTDSCFRKKSYSERCSPLDDCYNEILRCSDYGVCICNRGLGYDPEKAPYCQPIPPPNVPFPDTISLYRLGSTNLSYPPQLEYGCLHGAVWDSMRNRCVRQSKFPVVVDTGHGSYDRNRYSLFFAILIPILVLMIFLLKAKKYTSNPFAFNSRRVSRNSYAEALSLARESEFLPWNHLNLRLSEAGFHPHGHRHHHAIPRLSDQNASYCGNFQAPPPPYSSHLNLLMPSTSDRNEKPPSYEEAVYLSSLGHHHVVNHNNNNVYFNPNDEILGDPCTDCSVSRGTEVTTDGHQHYYYGQQHSIPNPCPQSVLVVNHLPTSRRHGRLLGSFIQGRERHQELFRREVLPAASVTVLSSHHGCEDHLLTSSGPQSCPAQVIVCENDSLHQRQHNHNQAEANHVESLSGSPVESSLPKSCYVSGDNDETQASMTRDHNDSHECQMRETLPQEESNSAQPSEEVLQVEEESNGHSSEE